MGRYSKAIAAFLGGLSTWGATALAENGISGSEWFGIFGVLAATAAVFQVTNKPASDEAVDQTPS